MSVKIKTPREIELMREAGRILALVHENLAKEIKPGMSTLDIDRLGEEMIRSYGCIPSFKNYCGYPASICVSVNEEVVHGIPGNYELRDGDIISVDCDCDAHQKDPIMTDLGIIASLDPVANDQAFIDLIWNSEDEGKKFGSRITEKIDCRTGSDIS